MVIKQIKKYLIIGTVMYGMTLQLCQGGNNEGKKEEMSFREYMEGMMKVFEIICQEQNRYGKGIIRLDPKKKDMKVNIENLKFIKDSTIEVLSSTVVFNVKNCMLIGGEEACRERAKITSCDLSENKKEIENMIYAYEGKGKEK